MRLAWLIIFAAALACTGGTCTVNLDDPGNGGPSGGGGSQTPLDKASLDLTIGQTSATDVRAYAAIRDARSRRVVLGSGQSLAINGTSLTGPTSNGDYTASLTPAAQYTLTVTEPTRGVQSSTLTPPGAFSILSPANNGGVSLSGFTVTWDAVDADLQTSVVIQQTLFDESRSATFGPSIDSGSLALSADNLQQFRQGAPLVITVRKSRGHTSVAGFASGWAAVNTDVTILAQPAP